MAQNVQIRIERVTALPGTVTPSTMYIVQASDAVHAELFFTGNDGTEVRHVINKAEVQSLIATAVSSLSNILVVQDIAARNALVFTQTTLVLVLNATGDTTVQTGSALYVYDHATTTFTKVAEYESLDLTLEWNAIQGRPTSSPAQIDAAVAAAHTHANKDVLDQLGETPQGTLSFNGQEVGNQLAVSQW